jgi:excisionase family DNA binding protein
VSSSNVNRPSLSVIAAAKLAGVCRRTVYNWIAAGKVEYFRTAGGCPRIFTDTLFREKDMAPLPVEGERQADPLSTI